MLNRIKISSKIALSFAILLAVMVIGSTLVLVNVARLEGATQTQTRLTDVKDNLTRMGEAIDEQHLAVLSLLTTGNRAVLADFEEGR